MKMNENTPKKNRVNVSWKSRRKFEITFDERQEIINLAIAGHSMNKIAELKKNTIVKKIAVLKKKIPIR